MKIARLHLHEFGNYEDRQFDFEKAKTVLIGPNNVGKSTVLDAIQWLLTGRCRGLDAAGRGVAQFLLRKGSSNGTCSVTANISVENTTYQLTRLSSNGQTQFYVKAMGGATKDWSGGTDDQEKAWFDLLGVSRDGLQALLDAETFLRREHADAKGLLLDFLKADITLPETGEIISLQECDRRYTKAFEARTEVNRQLKRMVEPTEPPKGGDLEGMRGKVDVLEVEQKDLIGQRAALTVGDTSAKEQREVLESKIANKRKVLPIEGDSLPAWTELVEARENLYNELLTAYTALRAEASDGMDLSKIERHDPKKGCVLHPDIECKTSESKFATFVRKHKKTAPSEVAKALEAADEAKQTLKTLKSAFETWKRLTAEIETLQDELSALADKAVEADPDAATGAANLDQRIASLAERIAKGRGFIEKWVKLQGEHERYQTDLKVWTEAKAAAATLETEVALYGPKGARVAALEEAMVGWQARVNRSLEPFGYTFALSVDPWGILVNGQPTARLSTSERLRVGVALQMAMAGASKVGLTLIDSVDWLLKANRQILMGTINEAGLEQVILAKAQDPDVPLSSNETLQVIQL